MAEDPIRKELDALKADIAQLRQDIAGLTTAIRDQAARHKKPRPKPRSGCVGHGRSWSTSSMRSSSRAAPRSAIWKSASASIPQAACSPPSG